MAEVSELKLIDEKGKRVDGRQADELRPIKIKANVLKSQAFFRQVYDGVATGYEGVERDYAYIDAFTVHQIRRPGFYDVVVTENMFGDIVSDLAAATIGAPIIAVTPHVCSRRCNRANQMTPTTSMTCKAVCGSPPSTINAIATAAIINRAVW